MCVISQLLLSCKKSESKEKIYSGFKMNIFSKLNGPLRTSNLDIYAIYTKP